MGYLDNSTIVVDAVLTKQGRKLLADGTGLNISYFTLSDTGIDYTLWNPDHPSGSAYYGEAIENLPNLEALPNSAYFMRNNLITLTNKAAPSLPYVAVNSKGIGQTAEYSWQGGDNEPYVFSVVQQPNGATSGWQCVVPDNNLVTVHSSHADDGWGLPVNIGGNSEQFISEQEIANAVVYETTVNEPNVSLMRGTTSTARSITITFISKSTGAYKHMNLSMDAYSGT